MKIVVLAGGISTERDVSLSTGRMIYEALKTMGHKVVLLDSFLGYEGEDAEQIFEQEIDWSCGVEEVKEINPDLEQIKSRRKGGTGGHFGPHVISICRQADVVFMALHGGDGEDGKIQAYFDLEGITYTGSGHVGSALAMDKGISKELFSQNKITTPKARRLKARERDSGQTFFPCIVKACRGGSSVGVSIAMDEKEYEKAKEEAFRYDEEVVIEEYISGREFSVGVLDGKALPVIEMAPKEGFYDYKNKYQAGQTVETCPAEINEEITANLQEIAEQVFRVLRLKSYARMDFIMERETNRLYCLEANTLPGMTPISLLPQEARAAGMSFASLCEEIILLAFREKDRDLEGEKEEKGAKNPK